MDIFLCLKIPAYDSKGDIQYNGTGSKRLIYSKAMDVKLISLLKQTS